jgi:4-hydroxybenzoate polyprenyltransferase
VITDKKQYGFLKTIKVYLKLGRLFGATNTWGAIFLGAVTSTIFPNILDAIKILIIAIFSHAYIGAINEYFHLEEDKDNPQYTYKPLVKGEIKPRNALNFIYLCYFMMIFFSAFFYPNILAFICIVTAALFGTLYTVKGKYIAWAYDITPSFGAAFLVIFGALAIGEITPITIIAAMCAFLISVYSEWIDGMKDVEIDRKFNVPTTAVRWGYAHDKILSLYISKSKKDGKKSYSIGDPNLIYFIGIVLTIDIIYSLPFFLGFISPNYLYIFLFIGIPIHLFLIYKLFGKQNLESLRKHPLYFLGSAMFLAFNLVIDKIMIWGILIILAFIIGWVYAFSLIGVQFSKD